MKKQFFVRRYSIFAVLSFFIGGAAFAQGSSKVPAPAASRPASNGSAGSNFQPSSVPSSQMVFVENVKFEIQPEKGSEEHCPFLIQVSDKRERDLTGKVVAEVAEGVASLAWLADGFQLVSKSEQKAVWLANLKSRYQKCKADAYASDINGRTIAETESHLHLDFAEGKLTLTLDVHARGSDSSVSKATVSSAGFPAWEWKGPQLK